MDLRTREWDWISAALLFVLLQVAAARLVTTDWAPYLYWTETMAGFGTMLGLALGVSRFRRGAVWLLACAYTAAVLPWQLTRAASDDHLLDRLMRVAGILSVSLNQFFQRQPVRDSLFFLMFVCLAFWLMGLLAGYWLARQGRVLGSIAIAGAAIVIIQAYGNYQPRGSWWIAAYVLIALLLAGRVHFLEHKRQWEQRRVFVSEGSGTDILTGLFMTAALAILVAWWIPSVPGSVERAADLWDSYVRPIRERLSNAVTSLQGPYGRPGNNFYGGSLPLGRTAAAGDAVVLTIKVQESPNLNMRYYWRGRVYDKYEAGTWSASTTSRLLFHPDQEDLGIPDLSNRAEGRFLITNQFPVQSLMYGPAPQVWFDRAADVAALRPTPSQYEAYSWEARTPLVAGSTYELRAQLRNPSIQELRAAGEGYPAWVTEHYLGVPERYRGQLTELASQISAESGTAYDKAAAITGYLRDNIEYASSVPAVPEGRDPVMWVLFEYRRGFCNYYASAEVLLLRSLGIPARLAVGFARGELQEGQYVVQRRDAHAWPEVYFPGIGWVEFEPTSSQDPLVRPSLPLAEGNTPFNLPPQTPLNERRNEPPQDVEIAPPATPLPFYLTPVGRALYTLVPILIALLAIILILRLRLLNKLPTLITRSFESGGGSAPGWAKNWERWNQLEPVERAFASVRWSLSLLGEPQPLEATPAVQAAALSRLVPAAQPQIDILRGELESGLFTPRPANLGQARRASAAVLFHSLRARIGKIPSGGDASAVYSRHNY